MGHPTAYPQRTGLVCRETVAYPLATSTQDNQIDKSVIQQHVYFPTLTFGVDQQGIGSHSISSATSH
jgi:hypothetical protein